MLPHRRFPEGLDGNFTAHLPRQLTIFDLRLAAAPAEAVGFPRKLVYSGCRPGRTTPQPRNFVAEYKPRFETFIKAGSCRKLTYTWTCGGAYHVDVLHNQQSGEWNIYKFNSGQLIHHACAGGYGEAMIRASASGLAEQEPGFTFAGNPAECQRENRAQAASSNAWEPEYEISQPFGNGEHCRVTTLVFGVVPSFEGGGNLVFAPLQKAEELAAVREALAAKTWGEFKLKMPTEHLAELLTKLLAHGSWRCFDHFYQAKARAGTRVERESLWQQYERLNPGERVPLDEDKFEIDAVACAVSGQWPERLEKAMLRWLPKRICDTFGRRVSSPAMGDYVVLDPGRAPDILAALEGAGYCCRWDENLIGRACGMRSDPDSEIAT